MPLIWKNGQQVEGSIGEFILQLRNFADDADEKFAIRSDFTAQLGAQLRAAANLIEMIYNKEPLP